VDRRTDMTKLIVVFRNFASRSVSDVDRRDCRAVCAKTFEKVTDLHNVLSARCIQNFSVCFALSLN
jgi:hypothetical protein